VNLLASLPTTLRDLPMKPMEHMAIGRPAEADQELIDEQMNVLELDDPYANPCGCSRGAFRYAHERETPSRLLTSNYITLSSLFTFGIIRCRSWMKRDSTFDSVDLTAYGRDRVFQHGELKR
jgi:hypothetical protein